MTSSHNCRSVQEDLGAWRIFASKLRSIPPNRCPNRCHPYLWHAVEQGAPIWRGHLAFRDALRIDLDLRARYQALKVRLANEHANDKATDTAAKGSFIRSVLLYALGHGARVEPAA